MLSRVTLSAARQRPFHTVSRLAFAQNQRLRRNDARISKTDIRQKPFKGPSSPGPRSSKYETPLRPISQQGSEQLNQPPPSSRPDAVAPASERAQSSQRVEDVDPQPLPDLRQGIPSDYDPDAKPPTPLPDLTQGIPSTIDAELSRAQRTGKASKESYNITEDAVDPLSPDAADRGGDGIPRSSYVSSSDRRRAKLLRAFWISVGLGIVGYGIYTGRNWSEEEALEHTEIANGYSPTLMYARAMARWGSTVSYYQEPIVKKLLPDASVYGDQMPPYTLVIGMEDVLVHTEWSREHGWRIAKRPGLDYFIRYLHAYYEMVLFSNQPDYTIAPIYKQIDPYRLTTPLTKEMTSWEDGGYVKDLSYLNRDLKKVVIVDCDPQAVRKQPENAIVLPPWTGDPRDTTLIDYIPFLEYLAALGYEDTREVLKSFEGKNIPVEFARRQKLLREKFDADQAKKRKPRSGGLGLGALFGSQQQKTQPGMPQSIQAAEAEGKMYTDIIRERGQEHYKMLEATLKVEGPKILAEQEAFEKQMQEEGMANMKSGMFGWFGSSKKE